MLDLYILLSDIGYKTFIIDSWIKVLVPVKGRHDDWINMAKYKKLFSICNTATLTLIVLCYRSQREV